MKCLCRCDGCLHPLQLSVLSPTLLLHGLQLLPQTSDLPLQMPDSLLLGPLSLRFPVSVCLICCVVVIARDNRCIILNINKVATCLLFLQIILSKVRGQRQAQVREVDL